MNILTNLISLLREEAPFFLHLTVEHLLISLSAIVVASLIGVLLGIFISEYRKYAAWLLGAVNVLYTIPSIASFVGAGGIDRRPDIINNKERFGDWEIDTIVGAFNKGAIVTLTERTTKMLLMKYLPNGKEAKGLAKAVIDLLICYLFLYL